MKRISFTTAVASCLSLMLVTIADAIDRTKTGIAPQAAPQNQFNPATLPGQGGLGGIVPQNDPFLPTDLFNPFPTLPGATPPSNPQGSTIVPNPQPGTYPNQDPNNTARVRIQNPNQYYIPPGQTDPFANRWRLGVMSQDTNVGVQIHEVVQGSAASRAGLEPNDIIVGVHGFQVGIVDGNLYELSKEFDRHADQNGNVTMLIQDNRTRTLMNITVQLDSRYSRINGSIALQNSQSFPANSTVLVELQEIVRQGAAPLTIASKEIKDFNPGVRQVPFDLQYDPAQVSHRGEYVLTAQVVSQGRQAFKTIVSYPINSQGYGDGRSVAMRLDPVRPTYDNAPQYDQNAKIVTIVQWFNEYLGRPPSDRELAGWLEVIQRGYSMRDVQLELLGHNQFFNRCGRDKQAYVTRVHSLLVGQEPNQVQLDYWMGRYDALGGIRREIAREFQDAVGIR